MSKNQQKIKILDNLICWSYYILLFLLPLIFCYQLFSTFELVKEIFFHVMLAIIWILIAVRIFAFSQNSFPKVPAAFYLPFFGYFLAVIISTIFSASPYLSFWGTYERQQGLFQVLFFLSFFTASLYYFSNNKNFIPKVIQAALWGGIQLSLFAVLEKIFPTLSSMWELDEFIGRIGATLGHPNFLATYLVMIFPLFFVQKEKFWKFASLLVIAALFFTGSRAGALAIFVEIIFLTSTIFNSKKFNKILIIVLATLFVTGLTVYRISSTHDFNRPTESRWLLLQTAIEQIKDKPFFGYGPEMYRNSLMKYMPAELLKVESFNILPSSAHNEILNMTINHGILSTIFYYSFFFWLIFAAFKSGQKAIGISLIGLFVVNEFGFSLTVHWIIFWLMAAVILASSSTKTKKVNSIFFLPIIIFSIVGGAIGVRHFIADSWYKKASSEVINPSPSQIIYYYHKAVNWDPFVAEYSLKAGEYSLLVAQYEPSPIREEFLKEAHYFIDPLKMKLGSKFNEVVYLEAVLAKTELDYTKSLDLFEKLSERAPLNPKYILAWARTLAEIGDREAALEKYNLYLKLAPQNPGRAFLKGNPEYLYVLEEIEYLN